MFRMMVAEGRSLIRQRDAIGRRDERHSSCRIMYAYQPVQRLALVT